MSRFLFAAAGSLGDLHPYIAVAHALIARGHQAVIATAEDYRGAVERAGVELAPVHPSLSELGDYSTLVARMFEPRRGAEYLMRQLIIPHLESAYACQWKASEGADLLVSHPLSLTLPLVAERRQLPWVSTVLSPMSFMSCIDPPIIPAAPWLRWLRRLGVGAYREMFGHVRRTGWRWEAPLRQLRERVGLPATDRVAMFEGQFSPLMTLGLFDPQLAEPQPDWPFNTHLCGSCAFDGTLPDNATRQALDRFLAEGDAPIVFALGSSAVWVAGRFWQEAAAAAQALGRRAILVTGPTTPTGLPAGVVAFPYIPYSLVFPRAAAVVHQAGVGTLAQAMRAGRPQLLTPLSFDQPDNARRAQALGVGRVLPFRRVKARRLVAELERLLPPSPYEAPARVLADALSASNGAACAADALIECLASARAQRTGG